MLNSSGSIPLNETERSGNVTDEHAAQLQVLENSLQDTMHQLNARVNEVEALKAENESLQAERSLLMRDVEDLRSSDSLVMSEVEELCISEVDSCLNTDFSGAIQDALETEDVGTTYSSTVYDTQLSNPGRIPFKPTTGLSARISVAVFEAFSWAKSHNTLGAGSCT